MTYKFMNLFLESWGILLKEAGKENPWKKRSGIKYIKKEIRILWSRGKNIQDKKLHARLRMSTSKKSKSKKDGRK